MTNKKSSATNTEDDLLAGTEVSKEFIYFFVDELKNIYWAEKHQLKILPKIRKSVFSNSLKEAFDMHLAVTGLQLERLEQIFELLNETSKAKKQESVVDLFDEVLDIIGESTKGDLMQDMRIVSAVLKIENYEIAAYISLVQWAGKTGNEEVISLLEEALSEEKEHSEMLTAIAEKIASPEDDKNNKNELGGEHAVAEYDSINLTGKNSSN